MHFEALQPWALIPKKYEVNLSEARAHRTRMRENFTHLRAERQPEFCPPWIQGASLGWRILSLIDVTLTPLKQVEVAGGESAINSVQAVGMSQMWLRGGASIAVNPPPWLNAYEFNTSTGTETMFIPNGLGTVEWRQGWSIKDFGDFGVLVIPSPAQPDLGVEIGLLSAQVLKRIETKGMSIAIAPKKDVDIRRGDEIARLIPISRDCQKL